MKNKQEIDPHSPEYGRKIERISLFLAVLAIITAIVVVGLACWGCAIVLLSLTS